MKVLSTLLIGSCLLLAACAGTPTPEPPVVSTKVREKDGAEMILVPAGNFQMGSEEGDPASRPQHPVTLGAYWIDKYEVTNARYERCVEDGGCEELSYANDPDFNGGDQPAVGILWRQAQTYCRWAGARLPTEAEWEYAARGPDGNIYPWGNDPPNDKLLNYDSDGFHTTEVGSYPRGASWVGALDMAGNASEWVSDWYGPDYYATSPAENPVGPDTGDRKVQRGGCSVSEEDRVRAFDRILAHPSWGIGASIGFRCAGH